MILSLPLYMFVVDDDALTALNDFLSAPRFLVLVFLSAGEEFQVGVLAPEGVWVENLPRRGFAATCGCCSVSFAWEIARDTPIR